MKRHGVYPGVDGDRAHVPAVEQTGGLLLVETIRATSLGRAVSAEMAGWREPITFAGALALTLALDANRAVRAGGCSTTSRMGCR